MSIIRMQIMLCREIGSYSICYLLCLWYSYLSFRLGSKQKHVVVLSWGRDNPYPIVQCIHGPQHPGVRYIIFVVFGGWYLCDIHLCGIQHKPCNTHVVKTFISAVHWNSLFISMSNLESRQKILIIYIHEQTDKQNICFIKN